MNEDVVNEMLRQLDSIRPTPELFAEVWEELNAFKKRHEAEMLALSRRIKVLEDEAAH